MPRPLRIGPTGRFRSPMPCGFSTLITVAPISPSIIAASGPVIAWPASITTMPSSGPVPVELALAGAGDPIGFKSLWIRASRRWERIAEHRRELRCATCHNWRRNAEPTSTGRRQGVSVAPAAPCACRQAAWGDEYMESFARQGGESLQPGQCSFKRRSSNLPGGVTRERRPPFSG